MKRETEHTFLILAFGESPYLEDCIRSLVNQSVKSEILITTSTPLPHISLLAERYKIPLLVNPERQSIGGDWNFAFEMAKTPYLTLAHQDDLYHPSFLEDCLEQAKLHHQAKPLIVFTRSQIEKNKQILSFSLKNLVREILILPFHFSHCRDSRFWKRFILLFSNSISCPGVFYVKSNLADFRFDEKSRYVLDWKAWAEMSQREGAFVFLPKVLHTHREHPDSATASLQRNALQQEEEDLLRSMWKNRLIPKVLVSLLGFIK